MPSISTTRGSSTPVSRVPSLGASTGSRRRFQCSSIGADGVADPADPVQPLGAIMHVKEAVVVDHGRVEDVIAFPGRFQVRKRHWVLWMALQAKCHGSPLRSSPISVVDTARTRSPFSPHYRNTQIRRPHRRRHEVQPAAAPAVPARSLLAQPFAPVVIAAASRCTPLG